MITTHVLDTAAGQPAVGMSVVLAMHKDSDWVRLASGYTDTQGRVTTLAEDIEILPGVHRLTFDTGTYHRDRESFFPEVLVIFKLKSAGQHIHVPLLVSPFGYTTYRGT